MRPDLDLTVSVKKIVLSITVLMFLFSLGASETYYYDFPDKTVEYGDSISVTVQCEDSNGGKCPGGTTPDYELSICGGPKADSTNMFYGTYEYNFELNANHYSKCDLTENAPFKFEGPDNQATGGSLTLKTQGDMHKHKGKYLYVGLNTDNDNIHHFFLSDEPYDEEETLLPSPPGAITTEFNPNNINNKYDVASYETKRTDGGSYLNILNDDVTLEDILDQSTKQSCNQGSCGVDDVSFSDSRFSLKFDDQKGFSYPRNTMTPVHDNGNYVPNGEIMTGFEPAHYDSSGYENRKNPQFFICRDGATMDNGYGEQVPQVVEMYDQGSGSSEHYRCDTSAGTWEHVDQCNDGLDNDGDGNIDHSDSQYQTNGGSKGADPGCNSPDDSEVASNSGCEGGAAIKDGEGWKSYYPNDKGECVNNTYADFNVQDARLDYCEEGVNTSQICMNADYSGFGNSKMDVVEFFPTVNYLEKMRKTVGQEMYSKENFIEFDKSPSNTEIIDTTPQYGEDAEIRFDDVEATSSGYLLKDVRVRYDENVPDFFLGNKPRITVYGDGDSTTTSCGSTVAEGETQSFGDISVGGDPDTGSATLVLQHMDIYCEDAEDSIVTLQNIEPGDTWVEVVKEKQSVKWSMDPGIDVSLDKSNGKVTIDMEGGLNEKPGSPDSSITCDEAEYGSARAKLFVDLIDQNGNINYNVAQAESISGDGLSYIPCTNADMDFNMELVELNYDDIKNKEIQLRPQLHLFEKNTAPEPSPNVRHGTVVSDPVHVVKVETPFVNNNGWTSQWQTLYQAEKRYDGGGQANDESCQDCHNFTNWNDNIQLRMPEVETAYDNDDSTTNIEAWNISNAGPATDNGNIRTPENPETSDEIFPGGFAGKCEPGTTWQWDDKDGDGNFQWTCSGDIPWDQMVMLPKTGGDFIGLTIPHTNLMTQDEIFGGNIVTSSPYPETFPQAVPDGNTDSVGSLQNVSATCWVGSLDDDPSSLEDNKVISGTADTDSNNPFGIYGPVDIGSNEEYSCNWSYMTDTGQTISNVGTVIPMQEPNSTLENMDSNFDNWKEDHLDNIPGLQEEPYENMSTFEENTSDWGNMVNVEKN